MSYGGEAQFQAPSQTQLNARQIQQQKAAQLSAQEAAARQQQIQSAPATATRQQAPGAVSSGSPQDIALRAEAAKEEQQAMVQANVHQIASSGGEFAAQREQALQRGKFDVSTVSYAFKGTPASYVTPLGQTVTRQGGGITGGGSTPTGTPIDISASQLAKTDALRASMGLPPLEQIAQTQVVKGTQILPTSIPPSKAGQESIGSLGIAYGAPVDISKAQLARTDALRASMGLPPLERITDVAIFTPGIQTSGKTIGAPVDISTSQLAKTDALRASMGLPPLEQIAQTKTAVKEPAINREFYGTKTPIQPPAINREFYVSKMTRETSHTMRKDFGAMQGLAATKAGGPSETEAVPFLSLTNPFELTTLKIPLGGKGSPFGNLEVPFIGLKETPAGTKEVPYTSILDAALIVPIGGGLGIGEKAAGALAKGLPTIERTIVTKTGEVVIPKGIKPPEESLLGKVSQMFSKPATEAKPSMEQIGLGRGLGREVSTGKGEGGIFSGTKPSGKPPTPPTTTTRSGQILEQITKERKVTTRQKPEFERAQAQKQQDFLKQQEERTTTEKATGKTKQEPQTRLRGKIKQEEAMVLIPDTRPPATKEGQTVVPIIPKGLTGLEPPIAVPKQGSPEGIRIVDLLTTKLTPGTKQGTTPSGVQITDQLTTQKTGQPQDQGLVNIYQNITDQGPPGKKTPPPDLFGSLGGSLTGGGGRGEAFGSKKSFIGNVPTSSIVGVYKRSEISYGERAMRSSSKESSMFSRGKFTTKKKGKIF